MGQDRLICPHCQYANVVLTCGFCLQCGEDIAVKAGTDTSSSDVAPAAKHAKLPLSDLIAQAAEKLRARCTETERGWRLTCSVGGGRQQTVHVLRGDEREPMELVAFLSLCGPAQPEMAMKLLEWNSRLVHCAFAVRSINGERMIVLSANLAQDALTLPLVLDAVTTIAHRGDYVERRMTAGGDRF